MVALAEAPTLASEEADRQWLSLDRRRLGSTKDGPLRLQS